MSDESFNGQQIEARVSIKNVGKFSGKEVVQVYVTAPSGGLLDKPAIELKAFDKTALIQPGESENLSMSITAKTLASYDPERSSWIVESGTYQVKIGASSDDIREVISFEVADEVIVETVNKALIPEVEIKELTSK